MPTWLSEEPAVWLSLADAAIVLAVTFGAPITDAEKAAIDALLVALFGVVIRSKVTPTAKLRPPP